MIEHARLYPSLCLLALIISANIRGSAQTGEYREHQRINDLQVKLSASAPIVRSLTSLRLKVSVKNTGKQDFDLGEVFIARFSVTEPGKAERLCDALPIGYQWSNAGGPPFGYHVSGGETYTRSVSLKGTDCGPLSSTDISLRVRICVENCIQMISVNGKSAGPESHPELPNYIYSNWLLVRIASK